MSIEGCPHGPKSVYPTGCPICIASQVVQEQTSTRIAQDLASLKEAVNTYQHNQIVYCQGVWACRVEKDQGSSIVYEPLEGYGPQQQGKLFTAAKELFKPWRENQIRAALTEAGERPEEEK